MSELCKIKRHLLFAERTACKVGLLKWFRSGGDARFPKRMLISQLLNTRAVIDVSSISRVEDRCDAYLLILSMKSSLMPEAGRR